MAYLLEKSFPVEAGAYTTAGEASTTIKRTLKQLGVSADVLRHVSVACYEVELNLVIHSDGGTLTLLVDPEKVTLISIPRDTYVDLGEHGKQKINSAYSIGGAPYTVQVVSDFAGVNISHYAEIDMDGVTARPAAICRPVGVSVCRRAGRGVLACG